MATFQFGKELDTSQPVWDAQDTKYPLSSNLWGSSIPNGSPYPTSTWWQNLVSDNQYDPNYDYTTGGTYGEEKIVPEPYQVKCLDDGIHFGAEPLNGAAYDGRKYLLVLYAGTVCFGKTSALPQREIESFTDLGVTIKYGSELKCPIVQGSAYMTAQYNNIEAKITTQHAIINFTDKGNNNYKVEYNNGQTWLFYSDTPLTRNGNEITSAQFTGNIRCAILPSASDETILDAHATAIPTGGTFNATVTNDTANCSLTYTQEGTGDLLMFALPHHQDVITQTINSISIRTMRGTLKGVIGNTFTWQENLPTIEFSAPRPIDTNKVQAIRDALQTDKNFRANASDPYFRGKQYGKMARLILVADEVGDTSARDQIIQNLKDDIAVHLNSTIADKHMYDTRYHGICSYNGMTDSAYADFGNGVYNDHHFHYGYHVYAAAVIGKFDTTWRDANKQKITSLLRDYMNPNPVTDTYFAKFRNKDFYFGASWANGISSAGNSKNQESTSESVNAYYAAYLWGITINDENIKEHGRILAAMEIRSAQKYWHVKDGNDVYANDPDFTKQKCVGILWSSSADYGTWFSAEDVCIHEIQSLPFTPLSEVLLNQDWVDQELFFKGTIQDYINSVPSNLASWKNFIYNKIAIIDIEQSWNYLINNQDWDDGECKTTSLYWTATRDPNSQILHYEDNTLYMYRDGRWVKIN